MFMRTEFQRIMTLDQIIHYLRNGIKSNAYPETVVKVPTISNMIRSLQKIRKQLTDTTNELKKMQKENKSNTQTISIFREIIDDYGRQPQKQVEMQNIVSENCLFLGQNTVTEEKLKQINRVINKIQRGNLIGIKNIILSSKQIYKIPYLNKFLSEILPDYERLYQVQQKLSLLSGVTNQNKNTAYPNLLTEDCLEHIIMINLKQNKDNTPKIIDKKANIQDWELTQYKINKIHDIYEKIMRGEGQTATSFLSSLQQIEKIPYLKKLLKPIQDDYGKLFKIFHKLKSLSGYKRDQIGIIVGPKLTDECVKCLNLMTRQNSKELQPIFEGLCQLYYPKEQHYKQCKPKQSLMVKCQWLISEIKDFVMKQSTKLCLSMDNYQFMNNKNVQNLLYLCDLFTKKQNERLQQIFNQKQIIQNSNRQSISIDLQKDQNQNNENSEMKQQIKVTPKNKIDLQKLQKQIREKLYRDIKKTVRMDMMLEIRQELINRIKKMSSQEQNDVNQIYGNIVDQLSEQSVYIVTISVMLKTLAYVMDLKNIQQIFKLAKFRALFHKLQQKRVDQKIFKNGSKISELYCSQEQDLISIINQIFQKQKNKQSNSSVLLGEYSAMMVKYNKLTEESTKTFNQLAKINIQKNVLQQRYDVLTGQNEKNKTKIKQLEQKNKKILDKNDKIKPSQLSQKQKEINLLKKQLTQKEQKIKRQSQQTRIGLIQLTQKFNADIIELKNKIKDQEIKIQQLQSQIKTERYQNQKLLKFKKNLCQLIELQVQQQQEMKIYDKINKIKEEKHNYEKILKQKQERFLALDLQFNQQLRIRRQVQKRQKQFVTIIQAKLQVNIKQIQKKPQKNISQIMEQQDDELQNKKKQVLQLIDQKIKQIQGKKHMSETANADLKLKIEKYQKSIKTLKSEIQKIKNQNKELKQSKTKMVSISDQKQQEQKNIKQISEKNEKYSQQIENLKKQIQQETKIKEDLKNKINQLSKDKKEIQIKYQIICQELKDIKQRSHKLKQLEDQIKINQQVLQQINISIEVKKGQISKITQDIEAQTQKLSNLTQQISDREETIKKLDQAELKLQQINQYISQKEEKLYQLEKRQDQISQSSIKIKQQKLQELLENIKQANLQYTSKNDELQQLLARYKDKKQQLDNFDAIKEQKSKQIELLDKIIIDKRIQLQQLDSRIQDGNLRIKQIQEYKIQQKQKDIENLKQQINAAIQQNQLKKKDIGDTNQLLDKTQIQLKKQVQKLLCLKSQQTKLQEKIIKMRQKMEQTDRILSQKQQKIKLLQQRLSNISEQKLRQKQMQFSSFDTKIQMKQSQVEQKAHKLADLQNIIGQKQKKLQKIQLSAEEKQEQISKISNYIKQKQISLQRLQERLKKISQPEIKQKQTKLQNILKQYEIKSKQLEQIKANAQIQRQAIVKIKKQTTQNAELNKKYKQDIKKQSQTLKQLFDKMIEIEREYKKKLQQVKKIEERQKKARGEYERYQKQHQSMKKQQESIIKMKEEFQQTVKTKLVMQSQVAQIRRNIRLQEQQRKKISQQKNEIQLCLKKLNKQLEQKKNQKSSLSVLQKQIKQKQQQSQDLEKRVKYLSEEVKKITNYLTQKQKNKQLIQDSIKQYSSIQNKLEESINKKRNQNLKYGGFPNRFFIGEVLEEETDRQFIIDEIYKLYPKRQIEKTKLLYTYPLMKDMNPHIAVDKCPHYIVIMKLEQKNKFGKNYIIAMYSQRALEYKMPLNDGPGFVCGVTNRKSFYLRKNTSVNPRLTEYNQFYFVFGNSQFRFRINSDKIEVNVGHNFRSLDTGDMKSAQFFTGRNQDINPIINYEFYQIMFKNQK